MPLSLSQAADPALLMQDVGLEPDPWQIDVLRSRSRRLLLLASRQSGKSTVTACAAMHQALYSEDSLVLLIAPTLRQSTELFVKVTGVYYSLDRPVPTSKDPTATILTLVNGSRIVTLPGDPETLRGFSAVSLAIIDEAARVTDAMIPAIAPMLAVSNGRLMLLSTPFGRRGSFFDLWESGDPAWERVRAVASECPRLDPVFLAEQRRLLGERMYNQEYNSEFVASDDQVFSVESIDDAFTSGRPALSW